jgi:hypothetical protein
LKVRIPFALAMGVCQYKATRFAINQEDLDKLSVHEEIVLEDIFEKELTI